MINYLFNSILLGLGVFPLVSANLPIKIFCGSSTDTYCVSGCTSYTDTKLPPTNPTLVYNPFGGPIHYQVPLPTGVYFGWITFIEPNKTAAGQRLLSVQINGGQKSLPVDIFSLAGGDDKIYQFTFIGQVDTNVLDFVVTSQPGANPIISQITIVGAAIDKQILLDVQLQLK